MQTIDMKAITVCTSLLLVFLATLGSAESLDQASKVPARTTICTSGSQERVISVVYLADGQKVPCEVQSTQNGITETLWNAQYDEGFCEAEARELMEKLLSRGWSCKEATIVEEDDEPNVLSSGKTSEPQQSDSSKNEVSETGFTEHQDLASFSGLLLAVHGNGTGPTLTANQANALTQYLEGLIKIPIEVIDFRQDKSFEDWLVSQSEIDMAIVPDAFSGQGLQQFLPLAAIVRRNGEGEKFKELFVVRQSSPESLKQKIRAALINMPKIGSGQTLQVQLSIEEIFDPAISGDVTDALASRQQQRLPGTPIELDIIEERFPPETQLTSDESLLQLPNDEIKPVSVPEEEIDDLLGEDSVATVVAQPNIPQNLRPPGVPVVRPGSTSGQASVVDESPLLPSVPKLVQKKEAFKPPKLLPEPEPEPGLIYIIPFVNVMVPKPVSERLFDQFVDELIRGETALNLQFVILKGGLDRVSQDWLDQRRYVTGEVYAYVEDSGCCSTDMRAKARISYWRPNQGSPSFAFEYPVSNYFDHDLSNLAEERINLAEQIASELSSQLLQALQN